MEWIINFSIAFPTPFLIVVLALAALWWAAKKKKLQNGDEKVNKAVASFSGGAFLGTLLFSIVLTMQSQLVRPMTSQEKLPDVVESIEQEAGEPMTDRMLKPKKTDEQRDSEMKEELNFMEKSQEILKK